MFLFILETGHLLAEVIWFGLKASINTHPVFIQVGYIDAYWQFLMMMIDIMSFEIDVWLDWFALKAVAIQGYIS